MVCMKLSLSIAQDFFGLRHIVMIIIAIIIFFGSAYLVRIKVGPIAGVLTSIVLAALLVWSVKYYADVCNAELAVPTVYEGDKAIDNDGAIRFWALLGIVWLPAVLINFVLLIGNAIYSLYLLYLQRFERQETVR